MREANAEKMKSMTVIAITVLDYPLDFVNLAKDENGAASPTADAHRRDCTINALFYNINEGKVEDYTGKGLNDLRAGIIRTPVDPMVTFTDEPNQALRVFRFANRFDFEIEESIFEATRRPEIHALINKVMSQRK